MIELPETFDTYLIPGTNVLAILSVPQPLQNLKRLKTILYLPECWNSNRIFLSLKVLCDNCSRFIDNYFRIYTTGPVKSEQ